MLIGWRAVPRRHVGGFPRRGVLAFGCVAVLLIGIVGCTVHTNGTPKANSSLAPAYRSSVSMSVSASVATSSLRESQHQQSLTTQAIRSACDGLATTSKDAIDKVNLFVAAYNGGRNTGPTEGPAIDALNNSANTVEGSLSSPLKPEMADAFRNYVDASRGVANAIATHAGTAEFNKRVDRLNDAKTKALKLCMAT
ncbi:hypothetical protein [Mycobacterium sp.]|uniref:hypothetical protein n=1 Tax=Mycobacterium sp. TaxID=1785 RepID=UPI002C1122B1|nr:hypothetical protein [Mycobacterium sp.]HTQ21210.1 hypothetical protein [Mycobacterium sp.]